MPFKLRVPCHANFTFAIATLHRSLPIAAVALALIALSGLAACGGGGDDDAGDATQTSPTASGAGNGAPSPTQPPAQTSETAPTTGYNSVELLILASRYQSIELNLTAGDTVSSTYSAIGLSTGGITTGGEGARGGAGTATGEVALTVLDPIGEHILDVEKMSSNTVEFQAELTGTYQMVFSNPFRILGVIVPLEYTINP